MARFQRYALRLTRCCLFALFPLRAFDFHDESDGGVGFCEEVVVGGVIFVGF